MSPSDVTGGRDPKRGHPSTPVFPASGSRVERQLPGNLDLTLQTVSLRAQSGYTGAARGFRQRELLFCQ